MRALLVMAATLAFAPAAAAQAPDERAAAQTLADAVERINEADNANAEGYSADDDLESDRGFQRKIAAAADRMRELGITEDEAKVFEGDG